MSKFKDKKGIAIITGASSGIGKEFAKQLQDREDITEFWLVARREARLQELSDELNKPCKIFALDLSSEESSEPLFKAISEIETGIKYLVNSAGYGKIGQFTELPLEDNLGQIELNITAVIRLTQYVLPQMLDGGEIYNLASVAAFLPQPEFSIYAASKSFVLSWSRALAEEKFVRELSLKLVAVCPNPVDTEFFATAAEGEKQASTIKSIGVEPVEKVVSTALHCAQIGFNVSVSSPWAKLIHFASKVLPTKWILYLERVIMKMYA